MREAWNTRAERTCRIEPGTDEETAKRGPFESYLSCSECRGPIQHTNYCPNCGAKVVE
jgi:predicted amidophosphoribosyltransferase